MSNNHDNNKTLSERHEMTTFMDMNMALDILTSLASFSSLKHDGLSFWLNPEQAALLRNLGISFARHPIKKWVPDDEWELEEEEEGRD